ncbi:hypothetical protein C5167_021972 [Papaver somniferum]|uniref:Uncharacterized protein n=1 Tax=Papaver somniferum TaxID=3469 RepID=A0A4Y7JHH3_PAPSO|nr:hypothetical protein C5167_021972 [Papaver somniferum]
MKLGIEPEVTEHHKLRTTGLVASDVRSEPDLCDCRLGTAALETRCRAWMKCNGLHVWKLLNDALMLMLMNLLHDKIRPRK